MKNNLATRAICAGYLVSFIYALNVDLHTIIRKKFIYGV